MRDRNRPLPGGIPVIDPSVNYTGRQGASFTEYVDGVMQARMGNPGLAARYRLKIDYASCEEYCDLYLGKKAFDLGYTDYYVACNPSGGGSPGNVLPPPASPAVRGARVAAAAVVSIEWIASGAEAVPIELATNRAEVCSVCPKNESGDWLSLFTKPAATAIKKALQLRTGFKLSTTFDDKIGVCNCCDCPLHLKVFMPIEKIKSNTAPEVMADFDPKCWILSESK